MLRTFPHPRIHTPSARLLGIALFTALTVLAARVSIQLGAVPFTLQTLTVVLAGLVLGARDGAASQLAYIGLVLVNLPVDARGVGAAALAGATSGYLIGFVPGAYVAGWLAERGAASFARRWLAGVAGIIVVLIVGGVLLKLVTGMAWETAWAEGIAKFIPTEMAKALIAAALAESGRALIGRMQ